MSVYLTTSDVPSITDIADLADDLLGLDPDTDTIVRSLVRLVGRPLDVDTTASVLVGLAGGSQPSILQLLAAVVTRLGNRASNPALRNLPEHAAKEIADRTSNFAQALTDADLVPAYDIDESAALTQT